MEGQKSFIEAANKNESVRSPEFVAEMVAEAQKSFQKLREYDGVEVLGKGAIEAKRYTEELALELTKALKEIPRTERQSKGLPDGPNIPEPEDAPTGFPSADKSGYAHTLDYTHAANDNQYPRVDQEQAA